ncbi:MAG: molybdopterin-dependent oxidoreductase, partial [Coriobacteriales bacterium]|nr:molybdopterin-dependent oxidoreductase [Coriobacteriales bacterium]
MNRKTVIRGISSGGTGGSLAHIDSEDGKIIRIRPLHWREQYTDEELKTRFWEIKSDDLLLEPGEKANPPFYAYGYKKRVYSKNRVQYPLKRIDWEPGGDPARINAQNRGKSKYKRISWDEASEIIVGEIKRLTEHYGANSIMCIGEDGHKESKDIHSGGGWHSNLLDAVNGNFTREVRTPDSVEGWYWGSKHIWGPGVYMGLGMAAPCQNIIKDVSDNTEMIVLQSGDWETTQNYASQYWSTIVRFWLDQGKDFIVIDPFCNYTSVCHDQMKWIPILPNTDVALDYAILYVWLTEGSYDKAYMDTHVINAEPIFDYILGKGADGVAKTPAWASEKCGIPEWTIKALARKWAKKTTSIGHYCATSVRGPYSHEPARTEVYKLCMQGVGKPGIHQIHLMSWTIAWPKWLPGSDPQPPILGQRAQQFVPKDQQIPRTMTHHAIVSGEIEWWGSPQIIYALADEQFDRNQYPVPEEDGGAPIHMLWSEKPCNQGCWNGGFFFQDAMRSPEVQCFITNHQWIENDSLFADLILPVSTCLEEMDDVGCSQGDSVQSCAIQDAAGDTVGESLSDYEIAQRVGASFGEDIVDILTQGMDVEEWLEYNFSKSAISQEISFEEFKKRGYYIPEFREDWAEIPAGLYDFYADPENNPLDTPSG